MVSVRITVDFWRPAFHGLGADNQPEWPPSPFRLAAALMSGCHLPATDADALQALLALTHLPNPVIQAPRASRAVLPDTYTHRSGAPLEDVVAKPDLLKDYLDLQLAGLSAQNKVAKPTSYLALEDCRLVFEVPDPNRTVNVIALNRAARRVAYFGRSQDGCDITVDAVDGEDHDDVPSVSLPSTPGEGAESPSLLETWRPRVDPIGPTRGWSPASCTWMDLNHQALSSGSQIPAPPPDAYVQRLSYRRTTGSRGGPSTGAHVRIVSLAEAVPPNAIPRVLRTLHVPQLMIDVPRVRAFPAVFAGHRYSDGRMHGVGLTSTDPAALEQAEERLIAARGPIDEERVPLRRCLEADHWSQVSTRWVSATPLRAFPDLRVAAHVIGEEILALTGHAAEITWSREPELPWQSRWRQPPDGLDLWWAVLSLGRHATGPIQLGATTDQGFGLFVPDAVLTREGR